MCIRDSPGFWESASYSSRNCLSKKGPRSLRSFGLFFLFDSSSEKKRNNQPITATSNPHSDPHKVSHSLKNARPRWKERQTRSELGKISCRPLRARHRLGRRESTISEKVRTSPCSAACSREPQTDQSQTVAIRHRIIDHHSRCLPTEPLSACCCRR